MPGKIKKLYKSYGKFNDQKQYKDTIESAIVYTPKVFTDNIPMSPDPYTTIENPSANKSLHQFSEVLNVKQKTDVRRLGASKSNRKVIR